MRICLDIQSAITQGAGIGRYTRELAQRLPEITDDEIIFFYFDFKRKGKVPTASRAIHRPVRWIPGRAVQYAWRHWNWPPVDWLAGSADLYHFPNFVRPPLRRGKSVVSVHDMSFLRYPEFTEEKNAAFLAARIQETFRHADAILTISQFSAREIAELGHVDPGRIHVTYPGISSHFSRPPEEQITALKSRLGLQAPYLLAVSTMEPRKNFSFLVDVFERMPGFPGKLVIAGRRGWKYDATLERIRTSSRAADILWLEHCSDADLPALYAGASLFVFPSFYEGFGFPPLEAMACGTPVLSSSGGSLAEVLQDHAVVLGDFNADLWAQHAARLLEDSSLRASLQARGRAHAVSFTWANTVQKTLAAYRKVLS